jgi:hypothetical protein
MNVEDRQLRLILRHKLLEFPQAQPFCLVCGAKPAGARRVYFEETRQPAFGKVGGIRSGIDAIDNRIEFDAPLCPAHLARARMLAVLAPILGVSAIGLIIVGFWLGQLLPLPEWLRSYFPFLIAGPDLIAMYIFWRRKDRGGIPCSIERLEESEVLLTYSRNAPRGPQA